jgi:serine/threonine protein kinase
VPSRRGAGDTSGRVVHRDFKPANVYLCGGGRVVITDSGIARATSLDTLLMLVRSKGTSMNWKLAGPRHIVNGRETPTLRQRAGLATNALSWSGWR